MTNKQAFDIFDKYYDDDTRDKLYSMLRSVGVDKTVDATVKSYQEAGKNPPNEYIKVMHQAFTYASEHADKSKISG